MKKSRINLPLLLLCFITIFFNPLFAEPVSIKWRALDLASDKKCRIVSATSTDNFWLNDATGNIFHYLNGDWNKISPPSDSVYHQFTFGYVSDRLIFCAAEDSEFKSHFFRLNNGRWHRMNMVTPVPVEQFAVFDSTNIYAFGSWGLFLQYKYGQWNRIDTKINEHIYSVGFESDSSIWLGGISSGVFNYNGKSTRQVKIEGYEKSEVSRIQFSAAGTGILSERSGKYYKYARNKFIPVSKEEFHQLSKKIYLQSDQHNAFAFHGYYWLKEQNGLRKIDVSLSTDRAVLSRVVFSDGSAVLAGERGLVMTGALDGALYFHDKAGSSYLNGSNSDHSTGAALMDLNNDNLPELFVLNNGRDQYNRLYLNKANHPFIDISSQSGLLTGSRGTMFSFADYNYDGYRDLLLLNGKSIMSYINQGGTVFEPEGTIWTAESVQDIPSDFKFVDLSNHNDIDLLLSFYYSPQRKPGSLKLFHKKLFGGFKADKPSIMIEGTGWNRSTLPADFNNDHQLDIYINNFWWRDRLLMRRADSLKNEFPQRISQTRTSNTIASQAIDYDNDGDLDLFLLDNEIKLSLLKNDGKGFFSEVTHSGFDCLAGKASPATVNKHICSGDFNNDGFVDIFITVNDGLTRGNWFFKNDSARGFIEISKEVGLDAPYMNGVVVGDIDADGDLDLFGLRNGSNVLWENNHNQNDFIDVQLIGRSGQGALTGDKIWLYEGGHNGDPNYLKSYRQVGSGQYSTLIHHSRVVHFGVQPAKKYDVRVRFQSGIIQTVNNIEAGSRITVSAYSSGRLFLQRLMGRTWFWLTRKNTYFYLLSIISTLIIMAALTRLGVKQFQWKSGLLYSLLTANLSMFWVIIMLTSDSVWYLKFMLPVLSVSIGMILPVGFSSNFNKQFTGGATKEEIQDRLLKLIMQFTHGEWALRNLNGLQLLLMNWPDNSDTFPAFRKQLAQRLSTFFDQTAPNIREVIRFSGRLWPENETVVQLKENLSYIQSFLENLRSKPVDDCDIDRAHLKNIAASIYQIKTDLREIKLNVFGAFSCNALDVIVNTTEALGDILKQEQIKLERIKQNLPDQLVLVRSFELAGIIDNCIRNAVRALKDSARPLISVKIEKIAPKTVISVTDNGGGISENDYEKIFQSGYSSNGGTGQGLFQAREILRKYGGRIYLRASEANSKTTFCIELNQGA